MEQDHISNGSRTIVFFWSFFCMLAAVALWLFVDMKLESERTALGIRALKDSVALSRVYSAYLSRSLEQMDQITMHVKSDWERMGHQLRLEDLKRDGLFTSSDFVAVAIIDRHGHAITSSVPVDHSLDLSDRDYFQFHRSNISTAMRIGTPTVSRMTKKNVIYFSRRLDAKDDSFDGVVLIAVEPAYFYSFYDNSILGNHGLLAVLGNDGKLRASTIGGAVYKADSPAISDLSRFQHTEMAQLLADKNIFADDQPRYVSWQDAKTYPLTIVVGLSKQEIFAPHETAWTTYRQFAIGGTVLLLFFAAAGGFFGIRLARREREAFEIRKTYRVATEGANEGFYIMRPITGPEGDIEDWELADANERGATLFGKRREQILGMRLSAAYPPPHFQATLEMFRVALASGSYEDDYKVPDDSPLAAQWLHRRVVKSENGLALSLRDISKSKKSEQELLRLANEDALTGLPNRYWLMRYLPVAMQRAKSNGAMLAVLFIDLDEFKNINDTLGHSTGDEVLKIAAQRIKAVLRPGDKVVRLGGDEFTVVVEQVSSDTDTVHVANRITQTLQTPIDLAGTKHTIGASIGISIYPKDGVDAELLLKNADIAMYSVKSNGKGHCQVFEPILYESLRQRLNNEKALQRAIEQDHFVLHYQPRVDTWTGELCGMEALVRWRDPQRGMVPPLEFIPLAESTGLILQLGELVIDKACRQIAAWKAAGLPVAPVSVNVSPRQFNEGDVRNQLVTALARHAIDAADIQIEITESAMMGDHADTVAELADIRAHGIKLLVDDFGTGYSSLSQLQRLDMDALKVDRAFTSELGNTTEGQVFFKAIVSMAHALGMKVTAEGVETMQQLAILRALGCDEVQGYFISRPAPAEEMEPLLRRQFLLSPAVRIAELSA